MKIAFSKKGHKASHSDHRRRETLKSRLHRFSFQKRRREPVTSGEKPIKRAPDTIEVLNPQKALTKATLTLNVSGNQRGMHAAGDTEKMQKIRAMRRIYNKQMPSLACSSCSYASSCPQFKSGYECAFLPFLNSHEIKTNEDLMAAMEDLVASNFRRAQQAALMETLSGAAPSLELSESLSMLFQMSRDLYEIKKEDDATLTIETEDNSIIGRLFGGLNNLMGDTTKALELPIEVTPVKERIEVVGEGVTTDATVNEEILMERAKSELARTSETRQTTPAVIEVGTLTKV